MRKILLAFIVFVITSVQAFSVEGIDDLEKMNAIQSRIDSVATDLLNCNKIPRRIVFVYDKSEKKKALSLDKTITKRQVVLYDGLYSSIQTDDELAAAMAREISVVVKSYDGAWGGRIDSLQVAMGSKKFETVADKRAVDYMVKAGYNPLGLIILINKTCPQKRSDFISRHNLTSKRLARIYEYITYKYPSYLENNEYINNKYYQNFLLTSIENRKLLDEKVKSNSKKELKYE